MKLYKFAVSNVKNPVHSAFWFYKAFPSAYYADQWATRITFKKRNSMYNVIFRAGEEKPIEVSPF